MNRQRYQLIITLKSDLCAGSGYAYAGIIDSDVCYDPCGLPYIPAKRLKGCLREAAELIGLNEEERNKFFGGSGQQSARGMFLDNAYIKGYKDIRRELIKAAASELKDYVSPQSILEQFTTVKAQTKIGENGVAKDNSLRFTRTVNHYSPAEKGEKELCFIADLSFTGVEQEEIENVFAKAVKAVRNIGMNRNRGLGSVRCRLEKACETKDTLVRSGEADSDEDTYILRYTVRNVSPLILSTNNDFKTEKYIGGRSVVGFFASAYLTSGKSADTEEFADLFLKNKVIYSAMYPTVETDDKEKKEQDIYYPAPSYINRLKKTKKYVNVTRTVPGTKKEAEAMGLGEEYASGNGNQPKKLKGKFVSVKDGKILVMEPETDIVYHHTKNSDKEAEENDNSLYTTEVLREQQLFAGEIIGKGKAVRILAKLLENGKLRFGKSKTSQYGTCVLESLSIEKAAQKETTYPSGRKILVVLRSDAMFLGDTGYTVKCAQIRERIKEQLGIVEQPSDRAEGGKRPYTEIEAGELTGYYTKWNLKRPSVPVIRAGSSFEFVLAADLHLPAGPVFLGECIGEGFGRADIIDNSNAKENCAIAEAEKGTDAAGNLPAGKKADEQDRAGAEASERLIARILMAEAKETLMQKAVHAKLGFSNSAALGRITLMLTDSINLFPKDADKRYENFSKRIESIKTAALRDKGSQILKKWIGRKDAFAGGELQYMADIRELREKYEKLRENSGGAGQFDRQIKDFWSDYLMAALVQEKYNLKKEEKRNEKG